ncbi:MAG: caspase family protein [Albidovulum sp.]
MGTIGQAPALALALAFALWGVVLPVAAAQRQALLIGVADYDEQSGVPDLEGPVNDVLLLRDTLRRIWGNDVPIQLLATTSPQKAGQSVGQPTRAGILGALNGIAAGAGPGDAVLIYLSGHGAQIPVGPGQMGSNEEDGLNEIFLPSDVALHPDGDGMIITNHILDDEFGMAIEAIMAKGATVWFIADSCHSGTLNRNGSDGTAARYVDLAALAAGKVRDGNPPRALNSLNLSPADSAFDVPNRLAGAGRFVGFFASHPGQKAVERAFDTGLGTQAGFRVHGVFTKALVETLNSQGGDSFGDLAQGVRRDLWGWGAGLPDPLFVGDLAVPSMVSQQGVARYALGYDAKTGVIVKAGSLAGLQPGAILQMRDPMARDRGILADLILRDVGLDQSTAELVPASDGGSDLIDAAIRAEGLAPEDYRDRWLADRIGQFDAVQVVPGAGAVLRIALPLPGSGDQSTQVAGRIDGALGLLAAMIPLKIVPSTADADIRLVIRGTGLEIVAGRGASPETDDEPYALPLASFSADDLVGALKQIAKAERILAIARALSARKVSSEMSVALAVDRATPDERAEINCQADARGRPHAFEMQATGPGAPIPKIGHCDAVRIDVRNGGTVALDVSPLYLDPQGRVFYLRGYTDGNWFGLRVPPGESRSVTYVEDLRGDGQSAVPTGAVFLVFLATEADPESLFATDFRHLEGDLPQASVSRGGLIQGAGLLDALRLAGAAPKTRGKAPDVGSQALPRAAIIAVNTGLAR